MKKQKFKNSSDKDWKWSNTDYSKGEKSPYSDWRSKRGDNNQEHESNETPQGNPDVLSEEKGLWFRENESEANKQLCEYIMNNLTPKQRSILILVAYEGKTFEHTAVILGISKRTVQTTIERIRKKFKNL